MDHFVGMASVINAGEFFVSGNFNAPVGQNGLLRLVVRKGAQTGPCGNLGDAEVMDISLQAGNTNLKAVSSSQIPTVDFIPPENGFNGKKGYYRLRSIDSTSGGSLFAYLQFPEQSHAAQELSVFPNPARDLVHIELPAGNSSSLTLKVYDAKGSIIHQEIVANTSERITINAAEWPAGMYYLMWQGAQNMIGVKKLIISNR